MTLARRSDHPRRPGVALAWVIATTIAVGGCSPARSPERSPLTVPATGAPGATATGSPAGTEEPPPSLAPAATPTPSPATPTPSPATPAPFPSPARVPIDLVIGADPAGVFAHQLTKTWCAPAAVQMTLAVLGLADTSAAFQRRLQERIHEWESRADSRNLLWGPTAMARATSSRPISGR